MPTLKQLNCSIELGTTNIKLKEYGKTYGDGKVETFIAIPDVKVPFHVHVQSEGYIAPGIAVFVYIDGIYHVNRNITGLKLPGADVKRSHYEVDIRLRQKEEKDSNGRFVGREWTFATLSNAAGKPSPTNPNFIKNVGTIEVVVLRCGNGGQTIVTPPSGPEYNPKKNQQPVKSVLRKKPQEESEIGGMFGLFDGAGDEKPRNGRPHNALDEPPWLQNNNFPNAPANYFFNDVDGRFSPESELHPDIMLPSPQNIHSRKPVRPPPTFERLWCPDRELHKKDDRLGGYAPLLSPGGHPPPWTLNGKVRTGDADSDIDYNGGLDGYNAWKEDREPVNHLRGPVPGKQRAAHFGRPDGVPVYGAPGPFQVPQPRFVYPQSYVPMMNIPQNAYNVNSPYMAPPPLYGVAPPGGLYDPFMQPAMNAVHQPAVSMRRPAMPRKQEIEDLKGQLKSANEVLKFCKDDIKKLGKKAEDYIKEDYISNRDQLKHLDQQLQKFENHERKVKAQVASIQSKLDSLSKTLNAGPDRFNPCTPPEATGKAEQNEWNSHSSSKTSSQKSDSHGSKNKDQNKTDDWAKQGDDWAKQGSGDAPGWGTGANDNNNKAASGGWDQNNNNQSNNNNDGWNNAPPQAKDFAWGADDNQNNADGWEDGPKTPEEQALDGQVARNTVLNSGRSQAGSIHSMNAKPYFADWQKSTNPFDPDPSKSKDAKKRTVTIREPYEYAAEPLPKVAGGEGPNGASLGVQAGRGATYSHRCQRPEYLDTMDAPYAVFTFKYRTKDALEKILSQSIDEDFEYLNGQAKLDALHALPKSQLIERLVGMSSPRAANVKSSENKSGNWDAGNKSDGGKSQHGWDSKSDKKSTKNDGWGNDNGGKGQHGWDSKSNEKSANNGWGNGKGGNDADDNWNQGPGGPKAGW